MKTRQLAFSVCTHGVRLTTGRQGLPVLLAAVALVFGTRLSAAADEAQTSKVSVIGEDNCFDSPAYHGVNALPLVTSQIFPTATGDTVVNDMDCMPGEGPKVLVGYWDVGVSRPHENPCVGEPMMKIAYPVAFGSDRCFCWKHWVSCNGREQEPHENPHKNSAKEFACGADHFKLTQWTNLTCSDDAENIDHKTVWTSKCCQDAPGNLYAQVLNLSGCAEN